MMMESYKAIMYGVFQLNADEQESPLAIFRDLDQARRWVNDMANREEFAKRDVLVVKSEVNGTYDNGIGETGAPDLAEAEFASWGNAIEALKCLHDLAGSLSEDQEEDLAEEIAFLERFLGAVEQKLLGQEQSK